MNKRLLFVSASRPQRRQLNRRRRPGFALESAHHSAEAAAAPARRSKNHSPQP